jgi:hypothetical protein
MLIPSFTLDTLQSCAETQPRTRNRQKKLLRAVLFFASQLPLLTVVLESAGCSSPPPTQWPGTSRESYVDAPAKDAVQPVAHVTPGVAPEVLAALVAATDQPYPSQGHSPPDYRIQVFVDPDALPIYRNWSTDSTFPIGTRLIARHFPRIDEPAGRTDVPLYVMHLDSTGWNYGAITQKGVGVQVATEICHDCHRQAAAPPVFGLPNR